MLRLRWAAPAGRAVGGRLGSWLRARPGAFRNLSSQLLIGRPCGLQRVKNRLCVIVAARNVRVGSVAAPTSANSSGDQARRMILLSCVGNERSCASASSNCACAWPYTGYRLRVIELGERAFPLRIGGPPRFEQSLQSSLFRGRCASQAAVRCGPRLRGSELLCAQTACEPAGQECSRKREQSCVTATKGRNAMHDSPPAEYQRRLPGTLRTGRQAALVVITSNFV
jgi:hypothetical protein